MSTPTSTTPVASVRVPASWLKIVCCVLIAMFAYERCGSDDDQKCQCAHATATDR